MRRRRPAPDDGDPGAATTPESTPVKQTAPQTHGRCRRGTRARRQASAGLAAVRNRVAALVWLAALLCAVVVGLGALLTAFDATNDRNDLVEAVTDAGRTLAGPVGAVFSFEQPDGQPDRDTEVLVNGGLATLCYLVVGRVLDRIVRA